MKVKPVRIRGDTPGGTKLPTLWGAVEDWDAIISHGYRRLSDCPEVASAVDRISELGGLMTLRMMQNTKNGDVRIKDALSRKMDVEPYSDGTRMTFISWIIQTLLLYGDGNAFVLPVTRNGYLEDLMPVPYTDAQMIADGASYKVRCGGVEFAPDDILHFRLRPDPRRPWAGCGYRLQLKSILDTLGQARETELGFMSSKWKPSVIVKVDAGADEFSSPQKRAKFLNDYIATEKAGQPWLIPGELLEVHQIKPLSLNDLAVNETVTLEKKTVAALLGVPPFLLGVGSFSEKEYNNFISSRLMPIMTGIQQELTKKLLTSSERYFRFNPRSLYSYSIKDLADVGDAQYVRGIMTGNEVRDWLGLEPKKGLDQLIILENFIPADMLGNQKKLIQKEGE